jgi:lysophospholipase L1-like esterase
MKRSRWFDVAAIAIAVAVVVGLAVSACSAGQTESTTPKTTATRPYPAAPPWPLALFIGDSYTAGQSTAELSYGCRAAAEMGWLCELSARGGTGYISGGIANRWVDPYTGRSLSIRERIAHLAARYDPAVVLLDGGRNDLFPPREETRAAMLATIAEARRTWPRAQIVFVRPRFLANPQDDLGFDDTFIESLKVDPAAQGVLFIDPISWLIGTRTSTLISADGIHPNAEGETRMTISLLKSLHSLPSRPVGSGL